MIRTPTTPDDEPLTETLMPRRAREMLHKARHPGATYSYGTPSQEPGEELRLIGYTLDEYDRHLEAINDDLLARIRSGDLAAWLDRRDGRKPERIDPVWWADRGGQSGPYDLSWDLLFYPDGTHDGPRVLFKRADIEALAAQAARPAKPEATPEEIDGWLAEQDRAFKGQKKPSITTLRKLGEAHFQEKWRKDLVTARRNDFGPAGPLFPNLHSDKPGPRSKQ